MHVPNKKINNLLDYTFILIEFSSKTTGTTINARSCLHLVVAALCGALPSFLHTTCKFVIVKGRYGQHINIRNILSVCLCIQCRRHQKNARFP